MTEKIGVVGVLSWLIENPKMETDAEFFLINLHFGLSDY